MGAVVLAAVMGSSADTDGPVTDDRSTDTDGLVAADHSMVTHFPVDQNL